MADKDYIDVREFTPEKKFKKELDAVEQEYVKRHEPYCARAARLDFRTKLAQIKQNLQEKKDLKEEDIKFNIDYEKYGNPKDFRLVTTKKSFDEKQVGLTKQKILIGMSEVYIHKPTGSGVTVFVPLEVYEERHPPEKPKSNTPPSTE